MAYSEKAIGRDLLAVMLLFVSFFAYSLIRSPIPGVNEPHYLAKSKHFWDPDWCRGDLFLESSNPHGVFYATLGGLTHVLTFEQTAWVGRVSALLLLAWGFHGLVGGLVHGRWTSVWAAWTFLGLAATGNLSGEWIVGGVEGKVFAYGFAFCGLTFAARRRHSFAAVCCGLAISFHPIVGVWSLVAALFAILVELRHVGSSKRSTGLGIISKLRNWEGINFSFPFPSRWLGHRDRPQSGRLGITDEFRETNNSQFLTWWTVLQPMLLLIVCALPGLGSAAGALGGAPRDLARRADEIQVFYRLAHHLDPSRFSTVAYVCYAGLTVCWFLLRRRVALKPRAIFFHRFVLASLLIAMAGLVVGVVWRHPGWMKFYPFRLFDVTAPLAASIVIAAWARQWLEQRSSQEKTAQPHVRRAAVWMLFAVAVIYAMLMPAVDRNPSRMSQPVLNDWIACCRWIEAHTPPSAQILTPSGAWAFKWFAERAEYVNHKDCPQDVRSLLEWKRRIALVQSWEESWMAGSSVQALLERFPDRSRVDFVVLRHEQQVESEPCYRGKYFALYQLDGNP